MSVLAGLFFIYRTHQKRNFACSSQYYASQKDTYIKVIFRLFFHGKTGVVVLTGEVKNKEGQHLPFNRQMLFSFEINGDNYLLLSQKEIRESHDVVDNATLAPLLNAFYYEENRFLQYKITKQKNGNYIVSNGQFPLAYCHKV